MFDGSPKNSGVLYFVKTGTWLLLFLLILELFVRNFIIRFPAQQLTINFGMVPMDGSSHVWGIEGYGITHYLSNGEIYTPYQSGTSVVVLGDSFTEAFQVSDDEKYVSVAERILRSQSINADLHNLGQSGKNIADYVYLAPVIRDLYSPSIVVVQVGTLDFEESLKPSRSNFFKIEKDQIKLIHQDNFIAKNTFDLNTANAIKRFGLGSLFMYRFNTLGDNLRSDLFKFVKNNQDTNDLINTKVLLTQAELSYSQKVKLEIDVLQNAYPDSKVVFLVIPNVPVIEDAHLSWLNQTDANLLDVINSYKELSIVYPVDDFQKLYETQFVFPFGFFNTQPNFGHLNRNGHQVVGAALAGMLRDLLR